nr:hypothetical protein [Pseudomonas syringae]
MAAIGVTDEQHRGVDTLLREHHRIVARPAGHGPCGQSERQRDIVRLSDQLGRHHPGRALRALTEVICHAAFGGNVPHGTLQTLIHQRQGPGLLRTQVDAEGHLAGHLAEISLNSIRGEPAHR